MNNNTPKYVLIYIRNGQEIRFPVKTVLEAINLANSIANSDLLTEDVVYNLFSLVEYGNDNDECWINDDGYEFEDIWRMIR